MAELNSPADGPATTNGRKQRVVIVLGMHRSGTSLLTSLLAEAGVDLGEKLIPGDTNNESGYWEQAEINRTHNTLLHQLRKSWSGPAWMNPFPLDWSQLGASQRLRFKEELSAIVREEISKAKGIWGFKDPRTSRLLPLWKEIFAGLGIEPLYILAVRNPAEVVASIVKRDNVAAAHAELLWLLHNLDAVRDAGDQIQLVMSYDRWFTHPEEQVRAIMRALDLTTTINEDQLLQAVRQRVRPDLRHWQTPRAFSVPFVAETHQLLEQAIATGRLPDELRQIDAAVGRAFAISELWTALATKDAPQPLNRPPARSENANAHATSQVKWERTVDHPSKSNPLARLIAFYLPQFHPIEENDRWWGRGFTEWTNVTQATPRFGGHYQPRIPGELGFYDLRLAETRNAQADLARAHGIEAFCYWHYWFNGRRILQRPFEEVLASGRPDFGFCLAWANENWTRRWDGQENEMLLEQTYGGENDNRAHFQSLLPAFRDPRAFRIDGKPVFLIYRPTSLPDVSGTINLWRGLAKEAGLPGLYLVALKTCFDERVIDWTRNGFDAELHFQPDFSEKMRQSATVLEGTGDRVVQYADIWPQTVRADEGRSGQEIFGCVTPSWDNSARRKREAFIVHNSTPGEYGRWLHREIARVQDRAEQHRVVFINAWNEWAEGNHLEPDLKWGRAYLEETLRANGGSPSIEEPSPVKQIAKVAEVESAESLLKRAALLRQQSNWVDAAAAYQTLAELLPVDLNVWRGRIECSAKLGHKVLSKLLIQDAVRIHPGWAAEFKTPDETEVPPAEARGQNIHGRQNAAAGLAAPAVSVIIPVLNKIELTLKCLDALRQNTPAHLYEVIVWDNASTDGTQAFFQRQSASNGAVRYFRSGENLGFVGGNNAAAQFAHGRFLVFLNNDTEPQPGWLEALLKTIEADPGIGAVGAKLIYPDGKLQEAGGIIFRDASGWNYGRMQDPRDPRYNFPREVDYCSAACLLVRAELFRQVGCFDSRYAPAYYEDTDLCFTLRHAGYKVVYQPGCEIIHHEGATAGQDLSKGFKQYQAINQRKFFEKWKAVLARQPAPEATQVRRASHRVRGQRILVVDPFMPMYDRASGSKRLFEILKLLVAGGNAVTFIARNSHACERYAPELEQLGIEVYAGNPPRTKEDGSSVNSRPYDLEKLLRDSQYDMVILSFWYTAEHYLSRIRAWSPASRVVIDTVDVHFLRERRQAELYQDKKLAEQAGETHRREIQIYRQADALITVTEDDGRTLLRELPGSCIFIVPNIHELAGDVAPVSNRKGLLFVGAFTHLPNMDAVLYFHHEIWPRVLQRVPGARWTIVGGNPPPAVQDLASASIQVTGHVPSVEPYLRSHLVSIAPLRFGAGMKGKIGEALAHGLPVVTTSIGAEGMGLTNGAGGALVADDPEAFAAHVARLYADHELWNQLSAAGRRHMESRFTPQCIERHLAVLLDWSASFTSIIVLAHNQWEHTEKCLQSIARHTPEPHEIILVDNGSTDKTPEALRLLTAGNARVRVVVNRDNRGFAAGNNQGLAIARGENILLLNNDTVVTPGWLKRLLSVFRRHADTGIVGPVSNCVSGPQLVKDISYTNLAGLPAFAERRAAVHGGQSFELARVVGFCLLARRDVIRQIGGLDERFGSGNFEDDDLCLRASLAGFKLRVALDSFVHHTGSQTFKGAGIDYRASLNRNWELFKTKWAMPKDASMEKGYHPPSTVPAGLALRLPLPDLTNSHTPTLEGRCWLDKTPPKTAPKKSFPKPLVITLPPCGLIGHLDKARDLFDKKKLKEARDCACAAIEARPFHPEAWLLLARLAQAAGDCAAARLCGERASKLAPDWKPAKQFLKTIPRKGGRPGWLDLPPALAEKLDSALRLSVCLIVKNEEQFLEQCLQSVRDIASQIVVVDTGSTDRTVEIAKKFNAEVHFLAWNDDFSAARNEALTHATGDWVLSLDADEELVPEHKRTILEEMQSTGVIGFRLPITNKGREKEGCGYVPRLFRNAPGLFFVGRVHEQIFSSLEARGKEWSMENRLGRTALLHHGYEDGVVVSRDKIARNLRLLRLAVEELPGEPNLVMNLGLEMIRSGQLEEGLEKYREALRLVSELPRGGVTPEFCETLLTQLTSNLLAAARFSEIAELWQQPFPKSCGLTASQHFMIGLAWLRLENPAAAAEQMRQCLAKRTQPVLSTIHKDIHTVMPRHCLALSLAALGQQAAAEQAFREALGEDAKSRPVRFDFAKFQLQQDRPLEALKLANEMIAENVRDTQVWQFGGQIALSKPEFLAFARDWTGEAIKNCPEDSIVLLQRAEALLLSEQAALALPLWIQAHSPNSPRHLAALTICELLTGQCGRSFAPATEKSVSREFLKFYRHLINCKARSTVQQLSEKLDDLRAVLPGAAETLGAAMKKAETAMAV